MRSTAPAARVGKLQRAAANEELILGKKNAKANDLPGFFQLFCFFFLMGYLLKVPLLLGNIVFLKVS